MKRRSFLKGMLAIGVGVLGARGAASSVPARKAADQIVIGPRRIAVSRLFMGTGSGGWGGRSNQGQQLGLQGLANLLRHGFDQGITGWDSADQYGTHPHLREALKSVPREKVVILTKTRAASADGMRADLERFRKEIGTDYVDILLLHCLTDPRWTERMRAVMEVIDEAQEKGIVRTKGVSCHSLGALEAAAKEPWVEVDLARINPHGREMDAGPETIRPILEGMKASGKGVIGMKIFGGGALVDRRPECLAYAQSLACLDAFTIGCENQAEFDEVLQRLS